jgi:energy-coupling factor transporter ATP-binding protein EcfA2
VLSIQAATFGFDERPLWSNLNLDVAQGEFIAIIGSNGSGKTSLLRAILGQEQLTSGQILLDGKPVTTGSRKIGYIPQSRSVDAHTPLLARDLLTMGLNGHRFGLPFTSLVKTLPLVAQLQSGSTRYKIGRVHEMVIDLFNSFGLEYSDGERVKWYQLQQQVEPTNSNLPPALTTGPVAVPIAGGYTRNPSLQIRQSTPLPATILSLMVSWDSTEQRG